MKKYLEQILKYQPINDQEITDKKAIIDCINKYNDDILSREVTLTHLTSSSLIFNKEMTKVLMAFHNIYKSWAWTGGHVDGDMDLYHVAYKEAIEETGIKSLIPISNDIVSLEILPVYPHYKRGKFISYHLHLNVSYAFFADENEETHLKEDENSGVMWINIDEIKKYCTEEIMIGIYEKIINKAKNICEEARRNINEKN